MHTNLPRHSSSSKCGGDEDRDPNRIHASNIVEDDAMLSAAIQLSVQQQQEMHVKSKQKKLHPKKLKLLQSLEEEGRLKRRNLYHDSDRIPRPVSPPFGSNNSWDGIFVKEGFASISKKVKKVDLNSTINNKNSNNNNKKSLKSKERYPPVALLKNNKVKKQAIQKRREYSSLNMGGSKLEKTSSIIMDAKPTARRVVINNQTQEIIKKKRGRPRKEREKESVSNLSMGRNKKVKRSRPISHSSTMRTGLAQKKQNMHKINKKRKVKDNDEYNLPKKNSGTKSAVVQSNAKSDPYSHWVRRSVRQPHRSELTNPNVVELLSKVRSNHPDVVVLKLKRWLGPDTPQLVMDAVLEALEHNTNCQALYIQNFNQGMHDEQMLHLLKVLEKGNIWCLNIGETYKIKARTWEKFAQGLKKTNLTHTYASEHTISNELKNLIRDVIRQNRSKHDRHNNPNNLDVIVQCTHCWWNPFNSSRLRPFLGKYVHKYHKESAAMDAEVEKDSRQKQGRYNQYAPNTFASLEDENDAPTLVSDVSNQTPLHDLHTDDEFVQSHSNVNEFVQLYDKNKSPIGATAEVMKFAAMRFNTLEEGEYNYSEDDDEINECVAFH